MKKTTIFMTVLIILCAASIAVAAENVSGIWKTTEGGGATTTDYLLLAQSGNNVHAIQYFELNGNPYIWYGSGTFQGNTLECSVTYTKNPTPGYTADGKIVGTLSADGKQLTGKWFNNYGNSGNYVYVKQK